ncbi:hypothetical protein [Methylocystis heyeri]|nr:hypothetical protein [Methylocystis heyeri]
MKKLAFPGRRRGVEACRPSESGAIEAIKIYGFSAMPVILLEQ